VRRDEQTHDAVVIESVFILFVCGAPLAGFLVAELLVASLFGLDSTTWRHVGEAGFGLAAVIAFATAVWLNEQLRKRTSG